MFVETAEFDCQLHGIGEAVQQGICRELEALPYSDYDARDRGIARRLTQGYEVIFICAPAPEALLVSVINIRPPNPKPFSEKMRPWLEWLARLILTSRS